MIALESGGMKDCLILVNPEAYGVKSTHLLPRGYPRLEERISKAVQELHESADITYFTKLADGNLLFPKNPTSYKRVGAVGGDGTLLDIIVYMLKQEKKPEIFWIPAGTGNGYAEALRLPRYLKEQIELGFNGEAKPVDIMKISGSVDAYALNFFSPAACARQISATNWIMQKLGPLGIAGHAAAFLWGWTFFKHTEVDSLKVDNVNLLTNRKVADLIVAKGYTPGPASVDIHIAERAPLDDGLMRVVEYHKMNRFQILALNWQIRGKHIPKHATHNTARQVEITCSPKILTEADGNLLPKAEDNVPSTYRIEVVPRAYPIVRP